MIFVKVGVFFLIALAAILLTSPPIHVAEGLGVLILALLLAAAVDRYENC